MAEIILYPHFVYYFPPPLRYLELDVDTLIDKSKRPDCDAVSLNNLAWYYYRTQKYETADQLYKRAEEKGSIIAGLNRLIFAPDHGLYKHKIVMQADHPVAMVYLAELADTDTERLAWLRKAAEKNDPVGLFRLGWIEDRLSLIRKAAELGHCHAMSEMGRREQSEPLKLFWHKQASKRCMMESTWFVAKWYAKQNRWSEAVQELNELHVEVRHTLFQRPIWTIRFELLYSRVSLLAPASIHLDTYEWLVHVKNPHLKQLMMEDYHEVALTHAYAKQLLTLTLQNCANHPPHDWLKECRQLQFLTLQNMSLPTHSCSSLTLTHLDLHLVKSDQGLYVPNLVSLSMMECEHTAFHRVLEGMPYLHSLNTSKSKLVLRGDVTNMKFYASLRRLQTDSETLFIPCLRAPLLQTLYTDLPTKRAWLMTIALRKEPSLTLLRIGQLDVQDQGWLHTVFTRHTSLCTFGTGVTMPHTANMKLLYKCKHLQCLSFDDLSASLMVKALNVLATAGIPCIHFKSMIASDLVLRACISLMEDNSKMERIRISFKTIEESALTIDWQQQITTTVQKHPRLHFCVIKIGEREAYGSQNSLNLKKYNAKLLNWYLVSIIIAFTRANRSSRFWSCILALMPTIKHYINVGFSL